MQIQTKTTILFTILTATVFGVLTFTVYYFSDKFIYTDFYKRLELRARIAAKFKFEEDHNSIQSFREIQRQYLERLPDEESFSVAYDANGTPGGNLPDKLPKSYLEDIHRAGGETVFFQDNFLHYAGLLYKDETGDFAVIESATNRYGNEIISRLGYILLITFIASVLLIYSVGLYFSRKTFQPFRYINRKVQAISDGNLALRLEQQEGSDEIAALIETFNTMLDRLSAAFEAQNNFVSNASHELRTPLTAIIAESDYALSRKREAQEYEQSLRNIGQQAEKLQKLTKGLLSLAQTAFDGKKQRWEKFRIDELLFSVKENVDTILIDNHVTVLFSQLPEDDEKMSRYGNSDLLRIALENIVLNACKYSNNGDVLLELKIEPSEAVITITDHGIGIPENEIKRIYDPFFRASNTASFEGYGIGMPLSNNIIRMHKGKIILDSKVDQGTTVTIILPLN
jgi:signal transduction histidine kinase